MSPANFADIQTEAQALGFSLIGIREPQRPVHYETFEAWLGKGLHASMQWLSADHSRKLRSDPALLLPDSRSLISLAVVYPPATNANPNPGFGRVASYARVIDYHSALTKKLKELVNRIRQITGTSAHSKVFVDSSPLLERDFAAMSGIGWIGKNTCLISPALGSFLFLAEILLDIELPVSQPFNYDRCGTCHRCQDACPTQCIRSDRTIDSNRCISYLTIENKGVIPLRLRKSIGDWVFGCDVCQIVCPWNRKSASQPFSPILSQVLETGFIDLTQEINLKSSTFIDHYAQLPIKRAGWENYLRNVIICSGNTKDPKFAHPLSEILLHEPTSILRSHAAWAIGQINDKRSHQILENAIKNEKDETVKSEIMGALDK